MHSHSPGPISLVRLHVLVSGRKHLKLSLYRLGKDDPYGPQISWTSAAPMDSRPTVNHKLFLGAHSTGQIASIAVRDQTAVRDRLLISGWLNERAGKMHSRCLRVVPETFGLDHANPRMMRFVSRIFCSISFASPSPDLSASAS